MFKIFSVNFSGFSSIIFGFFEAWKMLTKRARMKLQIVIFFSFVLAALEVLSLIFVAIAGMFLSSNDEKKPSILFKNNFFQYLENLGNNRGGIWFFLSLTIILIIFKSLVSIFLLTKLLKTLSFESSRITLKLTKKFLQGRYGFIRNYTSQEVTFALSEGITYAIGVVIASSIMFLSDVFNLFFLMIVLFLIKPIPSMLILFYFLMFYTIVNSITRKKIDKNSSDLAESMVLGNQVLQDGIFLFREHYLQGSLSNLSEHFGMLRDKATRAIASNQLISNTPKYTFEIFLYLGFALMALLTFLFDSGVSDFTFLLVALAASTRIMPAILRMQSSQMSIRNGLGLATKSFEFIREMDQFDQKSTNLEVDDISAGEFVPRISIKDVDFRYPVGNFRIENFNLEIAPGETVAFVGPSGGGKSTFIDLFIGVLEPDSGRIFLNKQTPRSAVNSFPGFVGYVPQVVSFKIGNLRDNLLLGGINFEIKDSQIWRCLESVGIDNHFRNLGGLETEIGERGVSLSGGQKQRLGIARALISNPKLLILDESTSAMDSESEQLIVKALDEMMGQVTLIVVAHRLATVKHFGKLIYVDNGCIEGVGTFEELRTKIQAFDVQARLAGL